MFKKLRSQKLLLIKNNGMDMKEIPLFKYFLFFCTYNFLVLLFVLITLFSPFFNIFIKNLQSVWYNTEIATVKNDNENLEKLYLSLLNDAELMKESLDTIKHKDDKLRELLKLNKIGEDTRKLGQGGTKKKDHSYNDLNYLLPNEIDIEFISNELDFVGMTINLENLSYNEIEETLNQETLEYYLSYPAIYPVSLEETYLSSTYGYRRDPISNKRTFHKGDDFAGNRGCDVYSTADGVVIESRRYGTFGNYIEIDHGNGYITKYGHLHSRDVSKGDVVNRGEKIGEIGNTGRSTAPHLHYEILFNKKNVNPSSYYLFNLNS